jgi:hypothetical protein
MKKILVLIVISFLAWSYYKSEVRPGLAMNLDTIETTQDSLPTSRPQAPPSRTHPRCDGREYCGQMNSREEAVFFINNCPNTKMDGDRDGIPCENDTRF